MSRLTSDQTGVLRRAAEARGGWLNGDEVETTTAASLVRRRLLEAKSKGDTVGLVITAAGRAAIGGRAEPEEVADAPQSAVDQPRGKLGRVVELLRREGGASLAELQEATGWQAHSVRGALAGALKKKHRLVVTSQKLQGRRVYMISAEVVG